jgi:hypothetical protein
MVRRLFDVIETRPETRHASVMLCVSGAAGQDAPAAELAANEGFVTIYRMLLPRFTLRSVLWGVAGCAVVALVAGQAVAGNRGALAALLALGGAVVFFVVYVVGYVVVRAIPLDSKATSIVGRSTEQTEGSP